MSAIDKAQVTAQHPLRTEHVEDEAEQYAHEQAEDSHDPEPGYELENTK